VEGYPAWSVAVSQKERPFFVRFSSVFRPLLPCVHPAPSPIGFAVCRAWKKKRTENGLKTDKAKDSAPPVQERTALLDA